MNRQATWSKIGKDITAAKNVKEALQISGLDYIVKKENIFLPNGNLIKNQFATVKEGTDEVFGIVGKEYEVVQNQDSFEFIDSIIPEGLQFVKAGENSNFNYIIAKLPENYVLGDKYDPYIIFQNSHNGYSTLRAALCPLRIVCQNQFTMAFKNADNKISLRHSSSIHGRLEEAKITLKTAAHYMDTFAEEAEKLAAIKISPVEEDKIISKLFEIPKDAGSRKINLIEERRAAFENILDTEDNQNFKGTAWGMLNAYSDYITHLDKKNTKTAEMNKFYEVTFNSKPMQNFNNLILSVVG